ncbi:MAG: hypothetical protein JXA97_02995 [Anaerolineales bacterium]|nr:hypothetical protein [Anaerolineales bacterium]
MIRLGTRRSGRVAFILDSPFRRVDPRTKLFLSLGASLAIMYPLQKLLIFMLIYAVFLAWGHLLKEASRQVWRLKWVLLVLFCIDWWAIGLNLAVSVVLRLIFLAGAFAFFFSTTTTTELRLALEWMRVPYRYAFSISLAFQSLGYLEDQWKLILEAQQSRGAWSPDGGRMNILRRVREMVALTVPAIVLTTKRAWAVTEAAYARGFDSPHYHPYRVLKLARLDLALLALMVLIGAGLVFWKGSIF